MARVLLLNSAVIVNAGTYKAIELEKDEFIKLVVSATELGTLQSYIGYEETAQVLTELTGVEIKMNRAMASFEDGDVLLVAKLNRRPNPQEKGNVKPMADDFTFMLVKYER